MTMYLRKVSLCFCTLFCSLLLLVGCAGETDVILPSDCVTFVSEKEKEAWRKELVTFLRGVYPKGQTVEVNPDAEDPDMRYDDLPGAFALALMDADWDGTPELVEAYAGGSSGNMSFVVYNLSTGEELMTLEGGYDGTWCMYYHAQTGELCWIGHYIRRCGWDSNRQCIDRLTLDDKQKTNICERLFQTFHTYALDEDFNIISVGTRYEVREEETSAESYYYDYMDFIKTEIRIPETSLCLIKWDDIYEDGDEPQVYAEKMADALLSSPQKFIAIP